MRRLAVPVLALLLATDLSAQATTVFRGRPMIKISEAGRTRIEDDISRTEAINLEVVISQIGDNYYWASRENTQVVPTESGAFLTYVATNGSGYVRVIIPGLKSLASPQSETEVEFDYVEHLTIGLKSVTYWGIRQP